MTSTTGIGYSGGAQNRQIFSRRNAGQDGIRLYQSIHRKCFCVGTTILDIMLLDVGNAPRGFPTPVTRADPSTFHAHTSPMYLPLHDSTMRLARGRTRPD